MSENDLELFFLHIKSLTSPSPAYRRDGLRRVRPTVAFVSLVSCTMEFVSLVSCPLWRLSPWYPAHCGVCLPRILPIVTFIMVSCPLCPLSWYPAHYGVCPGILPTVTFVQVSCPLCLMSMYPNQFVLCPGILSTLSFVLVSRPLSRLSPWFLVHRRTNLQYMCPTPRCALCSVHDKKNCRSNTKISKQNHLQIQNCIIHF